MVPVRAGVRTHVCVKGRGGAPRSPRFAPLAQCPFPLRSSCSRQCPYACSDACLCKWGPGGAERAERRAPVFIVEFVFVFMFALTVRFLDSIHWFDSLIRFTDSMPWFDSLFRFMDSVNWVDSLLRSVDSFHWFDSLVRVIDRFGSGSSSLISPWHMNMMASGDFNKKHVLLSSSKSDLMVPSYGQKAQKVNDIKTILVQIQLDGAELWPKNKKVNDIKNNDYFSQDGLARLNRKLGAKADFAGYSIRCLPVCIRLPFFSSLSSPSDPPLPTSSLWFWIQRWKLAELKGPQALTRFIVLVFLIPEKQKFNTNNFQQ